MENGELGITKKSKKVKIIAIVVGVILVLGIILTITISKNMKFSDLIKQADTSMSSKDYSKAVDLYTKALLVKDGTDVKSKLSEAKAKEDVEDATKSITTYYQDVKDGNIEGAYDQLADATKKSFPKEDFIKWQNSNKEISTLKEIKIEKSNEYKDKDIEGTKFKNVIEFNIVEKAQDLSQGKEATINYKRNVVNDNGAWKVYREKGNVKDAIADNSVNIAYMYVEGKGGKTKDLNQALTILNEALKDNKNYARLHYALGYVYSDLNRYDEALIAVNTYMSKVTDKIQRSDGYNMIGSIYLGKQNNDKAKENFNKAIELNSNNQYAKTNLAQLQ